MPASALRADGLRPEVQACLPEADLGFDVDYYEIGRASDGPDEYVYLEWFDTLSPAAAFDSHPALLRFRDGTCEVLLRPGFEAEEMELGALMPPAVSDEIAAETLAWKVAVAGGPEPYGTRAREIDARTGHQHRECAAGRTQPTCFSAAYASLLRGLGLDVLPPGGPSK